MVRAAMVGRKEQTVVSSMMNEQGGEYQLEEEGGVTAGEETAMAAAEGPVGTEESAVVAVEQPAAAAPPGSEGGSGGGIGDEVSDTSGREGGNGENVENPEVVEEEDDQVFKEAVQDELDSRLRPDHRFFAVRALVEGGKAARKLNRRMKTPENKDDGFLLKGNERYYRNYNESSIERRVNVSASFMYNGTCNTCLSGPHDA